MHTIANGCNDGGEFLLMLKHEPEQLQDDSVEWDYDTFVNERRRDWSDSLDQPIYRRLDHLLTLIARVVEGGSKGKKDLDVTEAEAKDFKARKDALRGADLTAT